MNAIAALPDTLVNLPDTRTSLLKRGERILEPDVYRTLVNGRPAVIKDYRRLILVVRSLAKYLKSLLYR